MPRLYIQVTLRVAQNQTTAPLRHGHIFDTGEDPRLPPPLQEFTLPPSVFSMPGNRQERQEQGNSQTKDHA